MSSQTLELNAPLRQYLLDKSLREPAVLCELRIATSALPNAAMQSSPEQVQLMQLLIKLSKARKALEIGVFTGYSTLAIAQALPEDGHIIACDINREWTELAQAFWQKAGVAHKIELRIAPALDTLDDLLAGNANESFDLIFIDADKANYLNYYERSVALVRKGGLIVIDNVLWYGAVADPQDQTTATQAIRALNDVIYQDPRVMISMLPLGDGVTLALKL